MCIVSVCVCTPMCIRRYMWDVISLNKHIKLLLGNKYWQVPPIILDCYPVIYWEISDKNLTTHKLLIKYKRITEIYTLFFCFCPVIYEYNLEINDDNILPLYDNLRYLERISRLHVHPLSR